MCPFFFKVSKTDKTLTRIIFVGSYCIAMVYNQSYLGAPPRSLLHKSVVSHHSYISSGLTPTWSHQVVIVIKHGTLGIIFNMN